MLTTTFVASVMATTTRKRKAVGTLSTATKRLRIQQTDSDHEDIAIDSEDDDEAGDEYQEDNPTDQGDSSEEEEDDEEGEGAIDAQTPNTPFSPPPAGRKKWPSEYKTLPCTFEGCNKTFNRPARLANHLNSHTNQRPFKCPHDGCTKDYTDNKHLTAHIKGSHTKERTYDCDWKGCGKKFLTGTRLRRHKDTHEGKHVYLCKGYAGCNETFRKHCTLERHVRSDHLGLAPYWCKYIDPETGDRCQQAYDGSVGLRKHEQNVHLTVAQFFCPQCVVPGANFDGSPKYLGFKTDTKLQAHIKKEHNNCPFCDLKVGSKQALDKHIESQHSGSTLEQRKTVLCTIPGCDKRFTKKSNLKAHIEAIHKGTRFVCGTYDTGSRADLYHFDMAHGCGQEYSSKAYLENHIRIAHLGLPDLYNGNRKKKSQGSEDEDEDATPKPKKKGGTKSYKPSATDELLGLAYENDPRRKFPCIYPHCENKFLREYDLKLHLRAKNGHNLAAPDIEELRVQYEKRQSESVAQSDTSLGILKTGNGLSDLEGSSARDDLATPVHSQGDPEWESGSQFWVGADDAAFAEKNDDFQLDEAEMRKLIDDVNQVETASG